ncbi:MAG: D-arabinono-1,4-lactone oxidase [Acidobacteriota bacterium]
MTSAEQPVHSAYPDTNPVRWSNWSGRVQAQPRRLERPRSTEAIQDLVKSSRGRIRIAGSGHSFTRLVATDDLLLSLEDINGEVLDCDAESQIATLQAGASLNRLSRALQAKGLAFKNLGDIDVQSIAGATSTATHGTGKGFPCLAAEIQGVELVTADGSLVRIDPDENPQLVPAAQVALGALGVLTKARVSVRPAYKLHRRTAIKPLRQTLRDAESLWDRHRNYEFFYLPFCDYAFNVTHEETQEADYSDAGGDDDAAVGQMKRLRDLTRWSPGLRRTLINFVAKRYKTETMIGTSWQMLANKREYRFNEMEYHLPFERGLEAFEELSQTLERQQPDVFFPIECRCTAGDDAWLSPFQGGPRISLAVHAAHRESTEWFYGLAEPIFRKYGGRPHWGKLHSLKHADLVQLYPDFERFLHVRRELDPEGRFLNPHLARLWGEELRP